jgi:hypothetical protein
MGERNLKSKPKVKEKFWKEEKYVFYSRVAYK